MNIKQGDVPPPSDVTTEKDSMQKLEEALEICKFGWFHVQMLITSFLSVAATTAVTTSTSYILPSAECDLDMNMIQKGTLNAIAFLGQFCSSLFTGFVTDAFGRKKILIAGSLGMCVFGLFGAASQTYAMLLFAKLMEGIAMSLSFSATASMVTEFTHKGVRDRVLVAYTGFMSLSIITATLLAWGILPLPVYFVVIKGYLEFHSWNIYLFACLTWSLIAAIMYWHLPESPKFLLSHGQENEALEVLKKIYRVNSGKDENTFPVTSLNVSGVYEPTNKLSIKKRIASALFDAKELYRPPLLIKLILFSTITFVCLLLYSALRLWFPQISTIVENYQRNHDGQLDQFCVVLNSRHSYTNVSSNNPTESATCVPKISGAETYTNGILLGFISLLCISFSGYLVDFFGQKILMFAFLMLSAICSSSLYFSNSSIQIAALISLTCSFMQAAFSMQHSILIRVFPTTVRTIALSIVMMGGRAGSLLGNIIFPLLMDLGCMVPFLTLSTVTICVAGLVYFLPNPKKENSSTGDK